MIEIRLKTGEITFIDDADFEDVSQYRWHFDRGYAARTITGRGIEYLHRFINKTPKGFSTDHINGNKLDNRRTNLRTCTQSQNNVNAKTRKTNTSGYRGVVWHKREQKWQAQIGLAGKCQYLGQFMDKNEAARVYNEVATEIFGQFAVLNEVR